MSYAPRYITAQKVVARTVNKVQYDLVEGLPEPDTATENVDGSWTLSWATMPTDFLFLYPNETGAIVTQSINGTFGQYGGTVGGANTFSIKVLEVTGSGFTTSDGALTITPDPNSFSLDLLNEIIAQAEAEVEVDLNPIYVTPFVGTNDEPFDSLSPQAHDYLTNLMILKSCVYVMSTDFGKSRGSNGGEDYIKHYDILYSRLKDKLFKRAQTGNLLTYPLIGLKLNTNNLQLPSVTIPRVFNDNIQAIQYAKSRINNPARTVFGYGYGPYLGTRGWN